MLYPIEIVVPVDGAFLNTRVRIPVSVFNVHPSARIPVSTSSVIVSIFSFLLIVIL